MKPRFLVLIMQGNSVSDRLSRQPERPKWPETKSSGVCQMISEKKEGGLGLRGEGGAVEAEGTREEVSGEFRERRDESEKIDINGKIKKLPEKSEDAVAKDI